ncbi:MAG: ankyrin repeat domain-containing protein [Bryobacteraceae bacterium]
MPAMRRFPVAVLFVMTLGGSPAAFEALRNGDPRALVAALDAGVSVNAKDEQGQTLLMHAVLYLPVDGVKLLLDRGAGVNLPGKAGGTALMVACGDLAKVQLLVERGADVNARSAGGNTALRHAMALPAGSGTVRYLLKHGAKPEARELNNAVRRGDVDLVRTALAAGAPVADEAMRRALGNEAMWRVLEEKAPQYRGEEARRKLVAGSKQEVTDLMLRAYSGLADRVRTLLGLDADVHARDSRGRTALMYAAGGEKASEEVIRLLLAKGADREAKDVRGDTALDIARQRGKKQIVLALGGKPAPLVDAVPDAERKWQPFRESLEKAVSLLEAAGPEFYKINGCISCHHQSIPQMAAGVARKKGLAVNEAVSKSQAEAVTALLKLSENNLWQMGCATLGGYVATLSYDLVGLAGDRQPRSQWTDLASNCLAKAQTASGAWVVSDVRHPLGSGDAKYTALSMRGLLSYPLPGLKEEYAARVARGAAYLESAAANDVQSLSFRILGLKWAGKPAGIPELARQLERLQRPNSGWAQHPEMATDAYATAIALWALHEGAGSGNGAWQLGAAYLRRLQKDDGSWHVRSRGFGFQPYRETGFPHGHDQWISSAATGFAVLALAPLAYPD